MKGVQCIVSDQHPGLQAARKAWPATKNLIHEL
jgi:hypothetical protein